MTLQREENPFVFGEVVSEHAFVDRVDELTQVVRDMSDRQKLFLLSPRRFGKSSLVAVAFERLKADGFRTVIIPVSDYASYRQFLEKFADKVVRAAGPWNQVKDWVGRFLRQVKPEAALDVATGEVKLSLGKGLDVDPAPLAPEVFALPGELATKGGFRMVICLDEFQQIRSFDGQSIENALRNAVQRQREVGYIFAGSQPSLMEEMLAARRPFHKAGPRLFLEKIPREPWEAFIAEQFRRRGRKITSGAIEELLTTADLIPYDVQRLAHELWDHAEIRGQRKLETEDVRLVTRRLVASQAQYYERLWEQLSLRQRAALQALAERGSAALYSEAVRREHSLGPASTVQKALRALDAQDIIDRYQDEYFFLDPLFAVWVRQRLT
ncbi:MAG: AAA family ATPase [Terriglobia bacterium]